MKHEKCFEIVLREKNLKILIEIIESIASNNLTWVKHFTNNKELLANEE